MSREQPGSSNRRWHLFGPTRLGLSLALGLALAPLVLPAQSNFVVNGSFELGTTGWQFTGASYVTDQGPGAGYRAAAGAKCAMVLGPVFQDLATIPGHDYLIQCQAGYWALPRVSWGETLAGPLTVGPSPTDMPGWQFYSCTLRATGEVTRLSFQTSSTATNGQPAVCQALDDVRVLHLQEPASIQTQPQSRSSLEGTGVSFGVIAGGAPPLRYQWFFNAAPILDANNNVFSLSPVRTNQAGAYAVLVSNDFGSVLSDAATLSVEPPATSPVVVAQPVSQTIPAGYGGNLRVVAFGAPPLRYQWLLGGTNLPGATNANLVFDAVQTAQAGTYAVWVTNDLGATLSLTATLTVISANGGSRFMCTNKTAICDVDGVTRLSGTAFSTQIYAGDSPDALHPLGSRKYFNSGWREGFFAGFWVNSPNVPVGSRIYAQVRVWESVWGETYEAARALGGKFGFSEVKSAPGNLAGGIAVSGFRLQAGLPFFFTGRLAVGDRLEDGTQQFWLQGQPGCRYLIERQAPPNLWTPLVVVTNLTGSVSFTDPQQTQGNMGLYRARILD